MLHNNKNKSSSGKTSNLFFLILLFSGIFELNSQPISEAWVTRFNGTQNTNDAAYNLTVDKFGNVYVTGSSSPGLVTIKYNSSGVQQWVSIYNSGILGGKLRCVEVDDSGNVYVAGYANMSGGGAWNYLTIKYNSSGIQQWAVLYNGPSNWDDEITSLAIDNIGNVYVTGISNGGSSGYYDDYATIKYNLNGIQQWIHRYNNGDYDEGRSIAVDKQGNVFVTGNSFAMNPYHTDYATIKYSSTGSVVWVNRYNGPSNSYYDEAWALVLDTSGNVYVTGSSGPINSSDCVTIKYDTFGNQIWMHLYNNSTYELARDITVNKAGETFVTGATGTTSNYNYFTIKYNSSGSLEWSSIFNGSANSNDYAYSIAADQNGNSYVTGYSTSSGTNRDYTTLKYNSSGVQQWILFYNGPGNNYDEANSVFVDTSGNIYVTGYSYSGSSSSTSDIATIKYSTIVGVKYNNKELPAKFSLSQNYPNPFNPSTVISYELAVSSFVTLKIYDMVGKEVALLVNENKKAGTYNIDWNAANYPSGIYFYTINTGDFVETKKMMLIK